MNRRWWAAIFLGLAAILLLLWLARAQLAAQFARAYFRQHGIEAAVEIGTLGLSGASAHFALGPKDAPDISADRLELYFDPLSWIPRVVEVRLVGPVIRARLDANGKLALGSLQEWIDSLSRQQGKSRFVSDDLAVSLTGLRLLLATPGGALEVDGDARLLKSLPASASLRARPTRLVYQGTAVTVRDAGLVFDKAKQTLTGQFSGAVKREAMEVQGLDAHFDAAGLQWISAGGGLSVSAVSLRLQASATSVAAGQAFTAPKLDMTARKLAIASANGKLGIGADLAGTASATWNTALTSLRAVDPALANAIRQNLARLDMTFAGHAERRDGVIRFALTQPLLVTGAKGGSLRIPVLSVSATSDSVNAALDASLAGRGLPAARLALRHLVWSGGGFAADAELATHFNFAMLRGADLATSGTLSWQKSRYAFTPAGCARIALAAFHPGAGDLAKNIRVSLCAARGLPLVAGEGAQWKLSGAARGASADLPLANARVENVAAGLAFAGEGAPLSGTATITGGQIFDLAAGPRFKPLGFSGTASLAGGVWRGRLAMAGAKNTALGEVTFSHVLARGAGSAHIAAPHVVFALDHLQPVDLSPLLAALRRAEGTAAFNGDVTWTHDAITSQGKLSIVSLDFMTVLGKAHAVKSDIVLTSLLPPVTAPGQALAIARIDWTLPLSAVDVHFGFSSSAVQIARADTDIAEGHAALGAITISLSDPGHVAGAAQLTGIALDSLLAASNLGSKVKLKGKVSGRIPFTFGPEGFRITNGHVAADGPGRLSVDRSLWAQGEAALASNAVQDFAYQALEYLAFEQMSADLNSVAGGRLQIVFHIKGRSDPPKPQIAEVAIADILNGTALQKPIPLPSGTPIDLTLDTSLNFDELLKSYAEAWSNSLRPEGRPVPGAKP